MMVGKKNQAEEKICLVHAAIPQYDVYWGKIKMYSNAFFHCCVCRLNKRSQKVTCTLL